MPSAPHKRRREQTVKILKMVALGVFLVGIGAIPPPWAIPRIIREITSKDTPKNRRQVWRRMHELKRRGYIIEGERSYEISERGNAILTEESLWELNIPTPKQWAREWYLVVFDIPSLKSSVRIPFIRHLQNLGILFYQRSVWIYPHPIKETVLKVARFYGITPYVSFITARSIDGSLTLKRKFKIV
ncbi:MAG: hypothetical protein AAB899_04285 [Patescibacteria group bacterium]